MEATNIFLIEYIKNNYAKLSWKKQVFHKGTHQDFLLYTKPSNLWKKTDVCMQTSL